ncbi:MAG: 50S ribosomal protein L21 [Pseudomonadales bacterium]|jgi:large subunit ribosomal protein L21|nr:50S ribosomal protein L21 [Pseudomonadales bacterium]
MKYAVVKLQGKQYKLVEGEKITVDLMEVEVDKTFDAEEVLLIVDGDKEKIGTPTVKGAKVTLKVLENGRGAKLRVFKYKSKSKYRRTRGHRQSQTNLEVLKIA